MSRQVTHETLRVFSSDDGALVIKVAAREKRRLVTHMMLFSGSPSFSPFFSRLFTAVCAPAGRLHHFGVMTGDNDVRETSAYRSSLLGLAIGRKTAKIFRKSNRRDNREMDAPMAKEERKEPSFAKLSDTPFFFFFGSNFYGRLSGPFGPSPESPSLLARKSKKKTKRRKKAEDFRWGRTVKSTLIIRPEPSALVCRRRHQSFLLLSMRELGRKRI